MKAPKALHALTIASARHLLRQGHITKPKHDKIVSSARGALRMPQEQAPMPVEPPPEPEFGSMAPIDPAMMSGV